MFSASVSHYIHRGADLSVGGGVLHLEGKGLHPGAEGVCIGVGVVCQSPWY